MLGQRCRRWANIKAASGECLLFAGQWEDLQGWRKRNFVSFFLHGFYFNIPDEIDFFLIHTHLIDVHV